MTIWLRRAASFEEEEVADREFWLTMTPDERVAAVEQMRQDWTREHGGDEGLRRVIHRVSWNQTAKSDRSAQ